MVVDLQLRDRGSPNMLWLKRNCWNLYRRDLFQLARNRIRIGIGTIA
jgi:hypothetical protein